MVIEKGSSETGLLGQRWERNLDIQPSSVWFLASNTSLRGLIQGGLDNCIMKTHCDSSIMSLGSGIRHMTEFNLVLPLALYDL